MIRRLLKWLFKKEYSEAMALVLKAKALPEKYVNYQVFDISSERFLMPMQGVVDSPEVLFWLLERQRQCDRLIKYESANNRDFNIGRSMLLDELLDDLKRFKVTYLELLEARAKEASHA